MDEIRWLGVLVIRPNLAISRRFAQERLTARHFKEVFPIHWARKPLGPKLGNSGNTLWVLRKSEQTGGSQSASGFSLRRHFWLANRLHNSPTPNRKTTLGLGRLLSTGNFQPQVFRLLARLFALPLHSPPLQVPTAIHLLLLGISATYLVLGKTPRRFITVIRWQTPASRP